MTTSTERSIDLRCSRQELAMGADPIGSAGCYAGYLLLEWPLPWPADLAELPELEPLLAMLRHANVRLQGVASGAGSDERHAIYYRRPADDEPAGFERRELRVPLAGLVAAAEALLSGGGDAVLRRDILVCTHGRRDRCCGSFGMSLFQQLANETEPLGPGVDLWRTSHTGGHRFAPTAIVLPEATSWAFLDATTLAAIVKRRLPLAEALSHYRGYGGLSSPAAQALERAVLGELGWDGFDARRVDHPLSDGAIELSAETAEGWRRWRGRVEVVRELPVPVCGEPIEAAWKTAPVFAVTELDEVEAVG